jgi:peptidyl-prolyl cis-trans isomerase C
LEAYSAIANGGRFGECPRQYAPAIHRLCRKDRSMTVSAPSFCRALGALAAVALFLIPAVQSIAPAHAQDPDPVLARVNGVEIRQSELAWAEEDIGQNMPAMPPAAKRDYLVTYLTDVILIAQAAEQKKLADDPAFKQRLAFDRNKLLMESFLREEGKASLSDEALHKTYDDAVKQMSTEQEVHARHILVATEDEAKAVLAELNKGKDFAELAKEKSKDPSAKENGGDLGYFTKDQMVPEFAEVAFKLDKGKISDPVKSQFGWHVIMVMDKRAKVIPPFEQVKPQIENYVAHKAQAERVAQLRATAKIEKLDAPAAATAPPADPALNPAAPTKK